jgi:branched-subunit amino acid ABC-type transport system permease component
MPKMSPQGLILTGILFGIINSFTAFFYSSEWGYLIAFTIAIMVITFRPKGLFGVRRE